MSEGGGNEKIAVEVTRKRRRGGKPGIVHQGGLLFWRDGV